jgi:hypothetical protein
MIVFGHRLYGTIDRCRATYVATRFVHIWFVPIIPIGSHLVVANVGSRIQSLPLGMHGRSVLAGYGRAWGLVVGALCAFAAVGNLGSGNVAAGLGLLVLALAAGAVGLTSLLVLGKLSPAEQAQRLAYAQHAGYPLDVALLPFDARASMRNRLFAAVVDLAPRMVSTGYRGGFDPTTQWTLAALEPDVVDPQFLVLALTLARLEWAAATGAARAQLDHAHGAILKKLMAVDPRLLQAVQSAA